MDYQLPFLKKAAASGAGCRRVELMTCPVLTMELNTSPHEILGFNDTSIPGDNKASSQRWPNDPATNNHKRIVVLQQRRANRKVGHQRTICWRAVNECGLQTSGNRHARCKIIDAN